MRRTRDACGEGDLQRRGERVDPKPAEDPGTAHIDLARSETHLRGEHCARGATRQAGEHGPLGRLETGNGPLRIRDIAGEADALRQSELGDTCLVTRDLCVRATGKPLSADPLLRHLEGKLRPLYGI